MKSPLLQKKGMDAFLQALNDPATTNPDDRTDKQYSRPEGKGTELEDMKSPPRVEDMAPFQRVNGSAKTGFTGLWKDIRNPHTTDLPPSMRLDAPGGCPNCGGGLTRRLNEEGEIEEVCTQCEYGPKKTGAAKPKCPHCGSSEYSLMPTDFETAKCDKCGKNWNHGIVEGINDPPKMAKKAYGIKVAPILHPKKFAAKNAPDPGQYDEEHEEHVRDEAKQWAQYAELGDNTEEIKPYDPSGNYLCGTCDMRQGENQCMRVNGPISFEKGSCRLYHKGAPENRLPMKKKFTQAEAKYSESDQGGFGCHRCEYGGKAKEADSAGRESWCSFWGMHIDPMSCCAENELEKKSKAAGLVQISELQRRPDYMKMGSYLLKKKAEVGIHETPTKLPPRDDMRGHLDEEVKDEMIESVDAPVMEGAKGVHVSAEDSLEFQRFLEPNTRDMKQEAQLVFMRDSTMQQEAQEAGMSMEEFWKAYGQEYANEYFAGRRASKTAMKVEEGIRICPKCTSNNVEEVTDGETKGGDSQIRLFECRGCSHLFSL